MKIIYIDSPKYGLKEVLLDDEDYERFSKHRWHVCLDRKGGSTFYCKRYKNKTTISLHRVILNIDDKSIIVDHKDMNGLNNQKSNLRTCTNQENLRNRGSTKNSSSKYKGVTYRKCTGKWLARIGQKRLGEYKTEAEAAIKYNEAAVIDHGDFARLNIIE